MIITLTKLLIIIIGGLLTPYIFVMIVSSGKYHLKPFITGCIISFISFIISIRILSVPSNAQPALIIIILTGIIIAFMERGMITLTVMGRNIEEAAWLGFGFGLIQSLALLYPGKINYPIILISGGALYHVYREALSSLFQSASAIILTKADPIKLVGLVSIQAAGIILLLAYNYGMLLPYIKEIHLSYGGLFSLPVIKTLLHKENT